MKLVIESDIATLAFLDDEELRLVKNEGYTPGKLVAVWESTWSDANQAYEYSWRSPLVATGKDEQGSWIWERPELDPEIRDLIGDYKPDEAKLSDFIARKGARALGAIKQANEERLRRG